MNFNFKAHFLFFQVNDLIIQNKQQYDNNLREDRVRLLLTQGDEGHRKLVQVAEEAGKKLVRLNEQWEQHRSTLMEQYQAAQSFIKSKSVISKYYSILFKPYLPLTLDLKERNGRIKLSKSQN